MGNINSGRKTSNDLNPLKIDRFAISKPNPYSIIPKGIKREKRDLYSNLFLDWKRIRIEINKQLNRKKLV
jgi:hypothetical protein